MSVKSGFNDFRKGLSVIFGKPHPGEGDRKLAKMSSLVDAQIPVYGKHVVRVQVIKSIESDMKQEARKGKDALDKKLETVIATPEYMALLHKLNIDEPILRVYAMEAMKKYGKK